VSQPIRVSTDSGDWAIDVDDPRARLGADEFIVHDRGDGRLSIESASGTFDAIGALAGSRVWIGVDSLAIELRIEHDLSAVRSSSRDQDALMPPMAATVVRVETRPGARVEAGDTLVVLEAMKMELVIRAPRAGVVRAVHCVEGQLVNPGTVLVDLDPEK
jgi:biotin carboxyl carrier protein